MIRFLAVFISTFLFISCATVEEAIEEEPEPVDTEEVRFPGWFDDTVSARAGQGQAIGYAKAIGSEAGWAAENARSQALSNLRFRVDDLLEEARREVAESNDSAGSRDFIISLRNSIAELDIASIASVQTDTMEEEQSILAIAKAEVDAEAILEALGEEIREYRNLWQQMLDTEALQDIRVSEPTP